MRKRTDRGGKTSVLRGLPALLNGYFLPSLVRPATKGRDLVRSLAKQTTYSVTPPMFASRKEGFFFFSQTKVPAWFSSPKTFGQQVAEVVVLFVADAHGDDPVVRKQVAGQAQPRVHHVQPAGVQPPGSLQGGGPAGAIVVNLPAGPEVVGYSLAEVVRIDEVVAGVVGGVDVDQPDAAAVALLKDLQNLQVVSLDDRVFGGVELDRLPARAQPASGRKLEAAKGLGFAGPGQAVFFTLGSRRRPTWNVVGRRQPVVPIHGLIRGRFPTQVKGAARTQDGGNSRRFYTRLTDRATTGATGSSLGRVARAAFGCNMRPMSHNERT